MPVLPLAMVGACLLGFVASVVIAWASHRSALWNMAFAAVVAFGVLLGALFVALVLTYAAYPS